VIKKDHVKFFDDNGYLFLDKYLDFAKVNAIRSEVSKTIEKIQKGSNNIEVLYEDDGSIRLVRNPHDSINYFNDLVSSLFLTDIASSLLKTDVYP